MMNEVEHQTGEGDVEAQKKKLGTSSIATSVPPKISLSPSHRLYNEVNAVTDNHLRRLDERLSDAWTCFMEDGDLKMYRREMEENGVVIDPVKVVNLIKGVTGYEVCFYFRDLGVRMEWEKSLQSCSMVELVSDDTMVNHNVVKRYWPATQRDALFWSHIRQIPAEDDSGGDKWMVVNHSTEHPDCPPSSKYVRIHMNVAMICQTIISPAADGKITRDNITCKMTYTADVNIGGWAPAKVVRTLANRECPSIMTHFASFVKSKTAGKEVCHGR